MAPQPYLDVLLGISLKLTGDVEAPTLRRYNPGISLYNSTKSSHHYSLPLSSLRALGAPRVGSLTYLRPLCIYMASDFLHRTFSQRNHRTQSAPFPCTAQKVGPLHVKTLSIESGMSIDQLWQLVPLQFKLFGGAEKYFQHLQGSFKTFFFGFGAPHVPSENAIPASLPLFPSPQSDNFNSNSLQEL